MKIYFEDGQLSTIKQTASRPIYVVDAKFGVSSNQNTLEIIKEGCPECTIYTNSLIALDNKYCWSDELAIPELYIRPNKNSEFKRVDNLTDKEIRRPHNLMAMYLSNAFGGRV